MSQYDEPLVGLSSTSPPLRDGVAGPVGEEHLPRDDHAHGARPACAATAGPVPGDGVAVGQPGVAPASRSISPRSGTYSPKGTRSHLVVAVAHDPSGL